MTKSMHTNISLHTFTHTLTQSQRVFKDTCTDEELNAMATSEYKESSSPKVKIL